MNKPNVKTLYLVSQVFYPDTVSTANLLTELAVELAKCTDLELIVLCAQPSYSTRERQPRSISYRNLSIRVLPSTNFAKDSMIGRLLNYLTYSMSLCLTLLFIPRHSLIVTVTNPPFLGIIISLVRVLKSFKLLFIIHDIQPDGLVRLKKLSPNGLVSKLWSLLNCYVLKSSEKIVVLGRDMADLIRKAVPAKRDDVEIIPNWQNEDLIHPVPFEQNPFVKEHQLEQKTVIQYSGNMGLWHDMKAFARLATGMSGNPEVQFCFIGDGRRRDEMFDEWKDGIPENTLFLPFQPAEQLCNALSACHIALISMRKELSGIAVPCKLYGILASGRATIAQVPASSEIAMVINEEQCGIVCEPGDDEALKQAVNTLLADPELRRQMADRARAAFQQKYTLKEAADRYKEILDSIK